jgi:predicted  nucleic acid-binding Zn-ribbon protein
LFSCSREEGGKEILTTYDRTGVMMSIHNGDLMEKLERIAKALEAVMDGKDKQIADLTAKLEAAEKRVAELEEAHSSLTQQWTAVSLALNAERETSKRLRISLECIVRKDSNTEQGRMAISYLQQAMTHAPDCAVAVNARHGCACGKGGE